MAHRGYHTAGAPENSVAALAAAQALEIYGSEFDVWVTADGRIVINHDKTFPGDSHVIENSTYDQLKNIKLSNGDIAPAALRADGIRGIDYTFSTISVRPDWIREAHDNGMVVNTWTVNAEQDMMSCIALGMDFITTNYPQTLKELLTKTFVVPN
ncbi:glycerophosphodiester phosphodiesterase family protein [Alistipes communis]|uniref:glycerophosphodiester phosphodiesterase family protein n=1 Tax=Alistipes communis TaxID=2585118 RepID=UPI002666E77B|nr:glycerophosphodiester phosphodiesterase family protein [Alistipes communis]